MPSSSVLFVCLGNICRSPMAEGAMRAASDKAGLDIRIDSCGTAGYHIGEPPDERAVAEASRNGVDISGLHGRQLTVNDFHEFDFILAMDRSNLRNVAAVDPGGTGAKVSLLMDIVESRKGAEVADPWYGGEDNFRDTWEDVTWAAEALVAILREQAR